MADTDDTKDTSPETEQPRRRPLRTLARVLVFLLALVAAPIVVALVLLHTPVGRAAVRNFLEQTVGTAVGGELRLGSLDYNLLRGRIAAGDLRLSMEGTTVVLGDARVRWSPWGGGHVRVEGLNVVVRDTGETKPAETATGLAAEPWAVLEQLESAQLVNGRVEMQDAEGRPYLVLGRVDATMDESGGRRPVEVSVADGMVGVGEARLEPVTGRAALAVADGALRIESLHLETDGSRLDAQGVLERLSPNRGSGSLELDVDAAVASVLSPQAEAQGRVRLRAEVTAADTMSGSLRLSAPRLSVQGVGPVEVSAEGRFDASHLVVERAEASGYGGQVVLRGPVALADHSQTDLQLELRSLDLAALARDAADTDVPLRARLDGSVRWTTQGWDVAAGRGQGRIALTPLAVADRRRRVPGLPVQAQTELVVEGRRVRLRDLRAEAHNARIFGDLAVSPELDLDGRLSAELPLDAVPALMRDLGTAPPEQELVGSLSARAEIGGSAKAPVATLRLSGEGLGTEASAKGGTASLEGEARYAGGRLELQPVVLRSGGGQATLRGGLPVLPEGGGWDVTGEVAQLDLGPMLAVAGVDGRGPLSGRLRIEGSYEQPSASAELDARVALAGAEEPIAVSASGTLEQGRLAVARLEAQVGDGRIGGKGSFDTATRALEVDAKAEGVRLGQLPLLPEPARRAEGVLSADVSLRGTPEAPAGEARVNLAEAALDGAPLPDLALVARSDGSRLELTGSTRARTATSGEPLVAGDDAQRAEGVFLRGGGPLEGDWPLRLEIDLAALPAQALLETLPATRNAGATLEARGRLVVDVALRDPEQLRYSGEELAASGRLRELEWSTDPFALQGSSEEATVTGLRLQTRTSARVADRSRRDDARAAGGSEAPAPVGGTLAVDGRVPIAEGRTFDLSVEGDLDLAALQAIAPEDRASGRATLQARVQGTLAEPDVQGTFGLVDARGRFGGARVNQVQLKGRLDGQQAFVDELSARVMGGTLSASGSLPLAKLGGGRTARLVFEMQDVDLSRMALSPVERGPDAPSLFVSMSGEVVASAPALDAIRAEGRFTRLESTSPEGTIGLAAPAAWRLADGRFVQEPLRLTGPLGTLEARAEATLTGKAAGSLVVAGPFDLRMLSPFVQDTTLAGPARIDLRAGWDPSGTRVEGEVAIEDGRLTLEQLAFTASQLKGSVRFTGDRATLEATAEAGDGRLVASGGMRFGREQLLGPAELKLEAQRIPISYPEGFRGRASGTIRVAGNPGAYEVTGEIGLTQAYYTAEFDERRQSLDRLDYQLAALRGEESLAESLPLSITVKLENPLRIRNSQAQLALVGTLSVQGTLAQPLVMGQVSLLEGGELTVRRARIRVQEGRVELNGYPTGVPEVDFSGLTQVGGVTMNLQADGSLEDLQLSISSPNRPDLSQSDLISLLLTGRTAQAAASQSGAIVAEELAAALGGALQKGVGESFLIDVSSDQSMLLDEGDPTQRFNVGTRISQSLSVIYSTRLDGTEQRWVAEWNPGGGRFRFRAIDDRQEGFALEAADRISFNLFGRRGETRGESRELRRLESLRLQGRLPLPEQELRDAADLKQGRRYDPLRLQRAADKVRALLVERGWRGASVDAVTEPVPGSESRVTVTLQVEPGPHVVFSWTGDDPGEDIREQAKKAWPPYASPEAAATAVARATRIALEAQGFYGAEVEHRVDTTNGLAEVALTVERGARGSAVDLQFEGNAALTEEALAATMPEPGSREFFEALDRGTRLTAEARMAYANAGYLRARVGPPRRSFDPASGVLTVTIPVRERGPSRVSGVDLPQEIEEAGAGAPALRLRQGELFDIEAYLADRDAIAAWYRSEGWMEARVRGVLKPLGENVEVSYAVEPGPRPRRADVRVASDGRTHERMVRRAVAVERGEIIRPQELSMTRARLSEMNVFSSVDVRPVPVDGQEGVRDLVVTYSERPDVDVEYGVRYQFQNSDQNPEGTESAPSSAGAFKVAGAVELANPFGWAWRLRAFTLQTTNQHNYRLGLESATLFGYRVRSQLLWFDETDDDSLIAESFASKVRGWSLQQQRVLLRDLKSQRWHERLRLHWGYTNKDISYSDEIGSPALVEGNRAFVSLSLIGDERDSLTDPRKGLFWTATAELARTGIGSDVNYNRYYGQLFTYVPLPLGVVWAQGYRAGVVPGDDPFYLLENRFQAGGPTTVRGFRQNGLGPQFDEDEGFGGQGVFVFNQELRFPIWKQLHGGVFWDAGNTWLLANEFSLRDLRHTVGGGLRFMLPFGPIRVEYGFILDRRKNSDGTYVEPLGRLVFGLGHAF